jgi:hypothetical protein
LAAVKTSVVFSAKRISTDGSQPTVSKLTLLGQEGYSARKLDRRFDVDSLSEERALQQQMGKVTQQALAFKPNCRPSVV